MSVKVTHSPDGPPKFHTTMNEPKLTGKPEGFYEPPAHAEAMFRLALKTLSDFESSVWRILIARKTPVTEVQLSDEFGGYSHANTVRIRKAFRRLDELRLANIIPMEIQHPMTGRPVMAARGFATVAEVPLRPVQEELL